MVDVCEVANDYQILLMHVLKGAGWSISSIGTLFLVWSKLLDVNLDVILLKYPKGLNQDPPQPIETPFTQQKTLHINTPNRSVL